MSPSPTPPTSETEANINRLVAATLAGRSVFSVTIDDRGPTEHEALEAQGDAIGTLLGAFDALLSLVVEKAEIAPGDGRWPHRCGREHRFWAIVGDWRAGGQSSLDAREALKDVIRAALIEQTGGER